MIHEEQLESRVHPWGFHTKMCWSGASAKRFEKSSQPDATISARECTASEDALNPKF
jgi:hypothetical protein